MEAVNKGMAKGAFWMILMRFAVRGIGLVSTLVLVRLLVPADFGLVAMAMTIIAAFELTSAFSFDITLIQKEDANRAHYDTAWTFSVIASALQALILLATSPLVAHFYNDPRLTAVVCMLALGVLVQGFENIGIVAFRKDMEFRKDFNFQLLKKLISFFMTMFLAFWLRNYWALIGGVLFSRIMGVAVSFMVQSYRPKFSLAASKELFHFSKWLFINNLLFFAYHQSASFILGKVAGPQALGLFTISYEISNLPSSDLVAPINRAIFPGYAKMAHDLEMLRQGFLNVFSAIALAAFPICIGIALLAEPLVHVMLGEKWLEAIPLIKILAITGLTQALQSNKGSAYLALGRPKILTLLAALHVFMLLPALIWGGSKYGALGAAWATLIVSIFLMPFNYIVLFRILRLSFRKFIGMVWRPVWATIIMLAAVKAGLHFIPSGNSFMDYLSQLILSTIIGGFAYTASIYLLWKISGMEAGIEALLFDKISSRFKRFLFKNQPSN